MLNIYCYCYVRTVCQSRVCVHGCGGVWECVCVGGWEGVPDYSA